MPTLSRHKVEIIRPSAELVRRGAGPEIRSESYQDGSGHRWRYGTQTQPFICSWCGRWFTGTAYICPPIVACSRHFTGASKPASTRAEV